MKIVEVAAGLRGIDVELHDDKVVFTLNLVSHGRQHFKYSESIELDDIDKLKHILECFEWIGGTARGRYTIALFDDTGGLQALRHPDGSSEPFVFWD